MSLFHRLMGRAVIVTGFALALPLSAGAQVETIETTDKPERSRPDARGPITAIRPAALWMATLDTNQDYKITRTEFEAGLNATFTRYDSNKDGRLSLFDIEDWRKSALGSADAAPHALQFDNDYNSTITRAEFDATLIAMFSVSDKNDDKMVSFDELVTVIERPQRRRNSEERERPSRQNQRGGKPRRR